MNIKKLMIVSLVVLAMTTVVFSQGRGRGLCYRQIQVQTPVMIEGKIVKIETFDYGKGRYGQGLHLLVQNNGQESEIHLGPQAWLNNQGLQLKQGDFVKIKAYQGTLYNGNPALFAAEVTGPKGGKTLMLRDENGFPMWRQSLSRGQGRGQSRGPGRGAGQGRRGW
jgi:hypothetical protein